MRLIEIKWDLGDNDGAVYEVRLPEEIPLLPPPPTTSLHPPPPSNQKLGGPSTQKLVGGGGGQTIDNIGTYGDPKTFIKTIEFDDDDEAFAPLVGALKKATEEVSGRAVSAGEAARWEELANVLIAELKIAAARTTVSSVPSFLAEHLRRRLWKVDKRQARAEGRELPDETLKTAPSVDATKCLDCAGSGWHYPEGTEKGVKKCSHEKLSVSQENNQSAT
jgi:hypothetical protein